jgi:hypothetical protein
MPKHSDARAWAACGAVICGGILMLSMSPSDPEYSLYLLIQAIVGAGLGALAAVIRNGIARGPRS